MLDASLHELDTLFLHFLDLLFAHRTAQHIGGTKRVTGEHLRGLHDLLLINQNAVGLLGDRLEQRVRVIDLHLAMSAAYEVRDQVHRSWTVERHERRDVLDRSKLELTAQVAHAT